MLPLIFSKVENKAPRLEQTVAIAIQELAMAAANTKKQRRKEGKEKEREKERKRNVPRTIEGHKPLFHSSMQFSGLATQLFHGGPAS